MDHEVLRTFVVDVRVVRRLGRGRLDWLLLYRVIRRDHAYHFGDWRLHASVEVDVAEVGRSRTSLDVAVSVPSATVSDTVRFRHSLLDFVACMIVARKQAEQLVLVHMVSGYNMYLARSADVTEDMGATLYVKECFVASVICSDLLVAGDVVDRSNQRY